MFTCVLPRNVVSTVLLVPKPSGGHWQLSVNSCVEMKSSPKTNFLVNLYWDNKYSESDSDSDSVT